MKKLLLASRFRVVASDLEKILPDSPDKLTVLFIPTAADPYEDKWFVTADRDKFVEMGFKIQDFNLTGQAKEAVEEALNKADLVFVSGGNTFYLLDQARKSGFAELLPKFIEKGVIYIGSSAGSYLVCPTIEASGWKNQDNNSIGLTNLNALNQVPFLLFVHYSPEHMEIVKQGMAKAKFPVRILTDDQAILVQGDDCKLVGPGEEIKL